MAKRFSELRDGLVRAMNMRGVNDVANAIPCDRSALYRIVNGHTTNPNRATVAGIERVVAETEQQQPNQEDKP